MHFQKRRRLSLRDETESSRLRGREILDGLLARRPRYLPAASQTTLFGDNAIRQPVRWQIPGLCAGHQGIGGASSPPKFPPPADPPPSSCDVHLAPVNLRRLPSAHRECARAECGR